MMRFAALAAASLLALVVRAPAAGRALPVGTCINMGNHLDADSESSWGGKRSEAADFTRIAAAFYDHEGERWLPGLRAAFGLQA